MATLLLRVAHTPSKAGEIQRIGALCCWYSVFLSPLTATLPPLLQVLARTNCVFLSEEDAETLGDFVEISLPAEQRSLCVPASWPQLVLSGATLTAWRNVVAGFIG